MNKHIRVIVIIGMMIIFNCTGCSNEKDIFEGSWTVTEATYTDLDGEVYTLCEIGGSIYNEFGGFPCLGAVYSFEPKSEICHIENDSDDSAGKQFRWKVKNDRISFVTDSNEELTFHYQIIDEVLILSMSKMQSNGVFDKYEIWCMRCK